MARTSSIIYWWARAPTITSCNCMDFSGIMGRSQNAHFSYVMCPSQSCFTRHIWTPVGWRCVSERVQDLTSNTTVSAGFHQEFTSNGDNDLRTLPLSIRETCAFRFVREECWRVRDSADQSAWSRTRNKCEPLRKGSRGGNRWIGSQWYVQCLSIFRICED